MENYVTRIWDFVTKPKVLMHDDGYFIFKFNSMAEKEWVKLSGPYYYNNKPIILQPWELDLELNQEQFSVLFTCRLLVD